ncbi:recombinase family protein [Dyella sp. M7H15-1]|uniref:recombinase family protein n=1 Tax=Dyella sp. M7H15-1 TaxID=2501295 RepID=UPI001F0C1554|nr:recombinase family protein [Dyella sp. M7H15-1]
MVEGLDRLSRAEPIQAQTQLAQIVNAGITVVIASDGREYNRERLKANPMDLVYSLLVMIRAHEESDTKSKRVKAAIRRQCEQWLAGTYHGIIRNGKDPKWLAWVDGVWHPIPERVEAVRRAITLFREGHGSLAIVDRLNAAGLSVTDYANTASYFYKLFRLPALIGVKTLSVDDSQYQCPGYYPAILSQAEYDELQTLVQQRSRRKGKGEIPGIITGLRLTYCGYCGSAMIAQNLMTRRRDNTGRVQDGHRRLACCSDQSNRKCSVSGSTSIAPIERALLTYCSDQIKLNNLLDNSDADRPIKQRLSAARSRCAELETQIEKLTNALLQDDGAVPLVILRKTRELETALEQAKREMSNAESAMCCRCWTIVGAGPVQGSGNPNDACHSGIMSIAVAGNASAMSSRAAVAVRSKDSANAARTWSCTEPGSRFHALPRGINAHSAD